MRKRFLSVFSIGLGAFGLTFPSHAAVFEGVTFQDSLKVTGGKTLILNGTALRTASVFNVRVYAAGLYLPSKSTDRAAILASPDQKIVRMVFLRDVKAEDIKKKWDESFPKNCTAKECEAMLPLLEKLKAAVPSVKEGESLAYRMTKDEVELLHNDQPLTTVKGAGFPNALLSTWIGEHPPSEKFREGLLGKS